MPEVTTTKSNYSTLNSKNNDDHSTATTVKFSTKQDVINNYTNDQQINKSQVNVEQIEPPPESNQLQVKQQRIRKSGWMYKLNQTGFKLWKKRYFVLNEAVLSYYSGMLIVFESSFSFKKKIIFFL